MLWLCFKLPSCLLGNTRDTSVMHEKAKFVYIIYMQPQKVKFKSVRINMKQVSYSHWRPVNGLLGMNSNAVILDPSLLINIMFGSFACSTCLGKYIDIKKLRYLLECYMTLT